MLLSAQAADGPIPYNERLASLQAQLALSPTNIDLLFQLGDLCHDEGVNDNPKAVVQAETYFKQLLAIDEKHARGRVMYGSTLTMKGRDAFWPPTQLSWVRDGNREMDLAVKLAPEDARVRFARANNNFHMPKFLGREEIVRADLEWLWKQAKENPGSLSLDERQTIASFHGQHLKKQKKIDAAIEVWTQGMALNPDSPTAREIHKLLQQNRKKE
jgi:tetratricopeptide (TPR) repeat protein